jgi:hypothetical protein
MHSDYDALLHNQMWHLVPPHNYQNIVDCEWIYKVKQRHDGTVDRYKTRPKRYKQWYGLDYEETFSPIVKAATIRLVFSLGATKRWIICQLDGQNAFLHGVLEENVYMKQPLGLLILWFSLCVQTWQVPLCLKQAPRGWYCKLSAALFSSCFSSIQGWYVFFLLLTRSHYLFPGPCWWYNYC